LSSGLFLAFMTRSIAVRTHAVSSVQLDRPGLPREWTQEDSDVADRLGELSESGKCGDCRVVS
jgi:hypothetical protein